MILGYNFFVRLSDLPYNSSIIAFLLRAILLIKGSDYMGFELVGSPRMYMEEALVLTYVVKYLQSNLEINQKSIKNVNSEIQNIRALLVQGGVTILMRKSLPES